VFTQVGFLGRIMLILMAALAVVILATLGLARWERAARPSPYVTAFPRLEQVAGVIELIRKAGTDDRPAILRAVNGEMLRVEILDRLPEESDELARAPRVEATLRSFADAEGESIRAYTLADPPNPSRRRALEGRLMRAVWRMPDGGFLVLSAIEAPRGISLRLFGLPPGIWIGILGLGVAGLALATVQREFRPLRTLTEVVAAFDGTRPTAAATAPGAPDIRRLAQAVHGMQERVAALLQERSFLIGAISHDLKTYLTRLRLRSESVPDPESRERIVNDLDAMTDLIETSLAFARGTTVSQRRFRIDLGDLVAVEAAERAALGAPIAMDEFDGGEAPVTGDPVALRRVVGNVLENAVKFGRTRVAVSVRRSGGLCRIVVDDDGPGIAEAERSAIFSPFYRVERSRSRRTGGSGLGLAIARQIVEAHGGTIEVDTAPLGGARLVVSLPAAGRV